MKLLVLGGTVFLGRHLVELALERGHEVTLFHRGLTGRELFSQLEHVHGNRLNDLSNLEHVVASGRRWDAVLDTSGYVPRAVRESATLLSRATDLYAFVSSVSVYAEFREEGMDEAAQTASLADPTREDVTGETYGALKALCEQAAAAVMGDRRTLVVRPGLIVGPFDPTDRFTYWPVRVSLPGEILAPGRPEVSVQCIDVRDLASWMINMLEHQVVGTFNAVGPTYSLGDVLEASERVAGTKPQVTWVSESFLLERGVRPWLDLPLWVPEEPAQAGFAKIDASRARGVGLTTRSIDESVAAVLAWFSQERDPVTLRAGLGREREAELLAAWDGLP